MRLVALALLPFAACTAGVEPHCTVRQTAGDGLVDLGKPAMVRAGLAVGCFLPDGRPADRPSPKQIDVTVEVFDPDNLPVAATATAPERSSGATAFDVTTDVQFTPDKPGAWTVIARFEPNIGRSQQLIRTLEVRTDAGVRIFPTALPIACESYALTASGTPVCLVRNGAVRTLAVGDQRFEGEFFAVDGDALWIEGPSGIQRLEPNDAGAYAVTHRSERIGSFFTAGNGAGYLIEGFSGFATRLDPLNDGGLARSSLDIGMGARAQAVAAGADRVTVFGISQQDTRFVVAFLAGGDREVIQVLHDGEQGNPVASGDGVIWLSRPAQQSFHRTLVAFDASAGPLRTQTLEVVSSGGTPEQRLSPQVPVVRIPTGGTDTRTVVPKPGPLELGFEVFDVGPGFGDIVSATRAHAFARSTDGAALKVIDR